MVECGGLENRYVGNPGVGGSNPPSSLSDAPACGLRLSARRWLRQAPSQHVPCSRGACQHAAFASPSGMSACRCREAEMLTSEGEAKRADKPAKEACWQAVGRSVLTKSRRAGSGRYRRHGGGMGAGAGAVAGRALYGWDPGQDLDRGDGVHGDFDTFWRSARAFWEEGRSTHGRRAREPQPASLGAAHLARFGLLEPLVAYRFFVLITLSITVAYLAWVADELQLRPAWAVVGGDVDPLIALARDAGARPVYPILAFGLVVAWMADRRERHRISGAALGLVVAIKPTLAPVLLWPLVRRRWGAFWAAIVAGAAATLVGAVVVGFGATLDWLRLLSESSASPYWDNASLPSAAARLFTDNPYAQHVATWAWTIPVAYALGIAAIAFARGPGGMRRRVCGLSSPRRCWPRPSPGTTTSSC